MGREESGRFARGWQQADWSPIEPEAEPSPAPTPGFMPPPPASPPGASGAAWAPAPTDPTAWPPLTAPSPPLYRSPVATATVAVVLLGLTVAVAAFGVGSDVAHHRLLGQLLADPLAVPAGELAASDERQGLIGLLLLALRLATGIAFIAWLWRVYGNVEALGARTLRFGQGWTIGGWFVPVLNLVRPKQVVDDSWRGAAPTLPAADMTGPATRVPPLFHLWWGAWLGTVILDLVVAGAATPEDVAGQRQLTAWYVALDAAVVVAGLLATGVVLAITQRHQQRHLDDPAAGVRVGRYVVPGAAGAAAIAGLCLVWFTSPSAAEDPPVEEAGAGLVSVDELLAGQCFDDPLDGLDRPAGAPEMAVVVSCSGPHQFEVYAEQRLDDDDPQTLLEQGDLFCEDAIVALAGTDWATQGYHTFFFYTPTANVRGVDRHLRCIVMRIDGRREWRLTDD